MRVVVFSSKAPTTESEIQSVKAMLDAGAYSFHLHKPAASDNELQHYLSSFSLQQRAKIILHGAQELGLEWGLAGVCTPQNRNSFIAHSVEQALDAKADHIFLSPIFESISKPGYGVSWGPSWSKSDIDQVISHSKVPCFALGGITRERIPAVKALGFAGFGVLGAVWNAVNPVEAFMQINDCLNDQVICAR